MPSGRQWVGLVIGGAIAGAAAWATAARLAEHSSPPTADVARQAGIAPRTQAATTVHEAPAVATLSARQEAKRVSAASTQVFAIEIPAEKLAAKQILRIAVRAFEPSASGATTFAVALRGGSPSREAHIGYFSMFPAKAFSARSADEQKSFVFDLTKPLGELDIAHGRADVVISAERHRVPAGTTDPGDIVTVDHVEIQARGGDQP